MSGFAAVHEKGIALIPEVLTREEVAILLSTLQNWAFRHSRAGIRHLTSNDIVAELARDPRILAIAGSILSGDAIPFRATLFDKSSDANWLVAWHQDRALPLRARTEKAGWGPWSVKDGIHYAHAPACVLEQVIALRLHLDDSTQQNGPLRVLPGTHKLGVLSDEELERLSRELTAEDCLASKGSVLAMRPLLIHSSSKSQNDSPRRVLHIEYATSRFVGDGLELAIA